MSAPGTGRPSNGAEGEAWMAAWCATCVHDVGAPDDGCHILLDGLLGNYPKEWRRGPLYSPETATTCDAYEHLPATSPPKAGLGDMTVIVAKEQT